MRCGISTHTLERRLFMKNVRLSRLSLQMILVAAVLLTGLVISQGAFADQLLPQSNNSAPGFDVEQLTALHSMGVETPVWMLGSVNMGLKPRPTNPNHPNFPLNCSDFNNGTCTYVYPGEGCCCVAVNPPPNSFCPDICA